MNPRFRLPARTVALASLCVSLVLVSELSAATRTAKRGRPVSTLRFDPAAERVDFFEGMKSGQLDVKVIPANSLHGNVLVENKTDKPLTVQLPEAFVGVQVLKQFNMGGMPGMGAGMDQLGGGAMGGMGGMGGMGQSMGGGMMGGMGGMGMGGMGMGGMGMGGGMFSIPPEQVAKIPYKSVCLEHGKEEPSPRMTYRLVKPEQYTKDPALQELVTLVGTGRLDPQAAQAAAWHLANKMSWRELAAKRIESTAGLPPRPYFSRSQLYTAQNLVVYAIRRAHERDKERGTESSGTRTVSRRRLR